VFLADCLQAFAFSALTLLLGWQEGHPATTPALHHPEWWSAGVVVCLEQGAVTVTEFHS